MLCIGDNLAIAKALARDIIKAKEDGTWITLQDYAAPAASSAGNDQVLADSGDAALGSDMGALPSNLDPNVEGLECCPYCWSGNIIDTDKPFDTHQCTMCDYEWAVTLQHPNNLNVSSILQSAPATPGAEEVPDRCVTCRECK